MTDKESAVFSIKRGTKQGDPVSSLLFNTVLQFALEDDLKRWQEKHKGIRLSDKKEDFLTNLRLGRPPIGAPKTITLCTVHLHNVVAKKRDAATALLQR